MSSITNFVFSPFQNGQTLLGEDLNGLAYSIQAVLDQVIADNRVTPLLPASFVGENRIAAVINNSIISIDNNGNVTLTSRQFFDDAVAAAANSAAIALSATTSNATSSSTLSVSTGSKSFTLNQTGKSFVVGQFVVIASTATPASKWMNGAITAYDSVTGAMTATVNNCQGNGSASAWTITPSAPINSAGYTGQPIVVTGTSQNSAPHFHPSMISGGYYIFGNTSAQTTATLNPTPNDGEEITFDNATGRGDMQIDPGTKAIMGDAGIMTNVLRGCWKLKFVAALDSWRFV